MVPALLLASKVSCSITNTNSTTSTSYTINASSRYKRAKLGSKNNTLRETLVSSSTLQIA